MVTKITAPYGEWQSPISIEDATAGSKSLSSPRADLTTHRAFFLESKPSGASTIVEVVQDSSSSDTQHNLVNVLPDPHSVSTAVYEYGGCPYEVLPGGSRLIFSDAKDGNALKRLDIHDDENKENTVTTLVGAKPHLRYADFGVGGVGKRTRWVLAVEEDHSKPAPADVKNYVVVVDVETGETVRLVEGADFYTTPRWSGDGCWVSWREWMHPEMAWTKSTLKWARVEETEDGKLGLVEDSVAVLAGGKQGEPVGESAWALDGALYFTHETADSDWRQMYRVWPGTDKPKVEKLKLKGLEEVEMGDCSMLLNRNTFVFLSPTAMILTYTKFATYFTVHVDLETLHVTPLTVPLLDLRNDPFAAISSSSFLAIGAGVTQPQGVYHFSLSNNNKTTTMTQLTSAYEKSYPPSLFAKPQHIQLTGQDPERPIHGFYWPPHNPHYTAPASSSTAPPLIVNPHGGPTGHSSPGLRIGGVGGGNVPFWTTRGFAYFAINYTGSSAHGAAYRQRLDGQWGVLDRDDVPACIAHLAERGLADPQRVGIHGGSAGGYNVLQSLVWHPDVFAGGVCYCGVSDVAKLAEGTHKLESHYLEGLLYSPGMSAEERKKVERERSPVFHAKRITAPLLLVHGDADTVVPVAQSVEIARLVREGGGEVDMVVVPGEGHMFKMKESVVMALEKEVAWFMKTLVKKE